MLKNVPVAPRVRVVAEKYGDAQVRREKKGRRSSAEYLRVEYSKL